MYTILMHLSVHAFLCLFIIRIDLILKFHNLAVRNSERSHLNRNSAFLTAAKRCKSKAPLMTSNII